MRKRSDSNNGFCLCESAATATTGFVCAKAQRQQQRVLFVRKRSDSNNGFCLCESAATATTGFVCAKAQRQQQHDVGHEGVITGCDAFSLRSSIANPQGVAQS
ncbi:hypothetical protein LAV72_17245 [Lysinibacillus xylanilyticus]|uniref:hypothetical protein n=1 Tax=Lysinibacillus xylanilyticus TaxID=582475 RepID=UPI002B24533D|nr:hypothetical protein [Lysinibacillus xylanilyticus]MEB2301366.1 hypothetical protein [Lysinibacillus xylanilyticus]